jgi:hypothetical protein
VIFIDADSLLLPASAGLSLWSPALPLPLLPVLSLPLSLAPAPPLLSLPALLSSSSEHAGTTAVSAKARKRNLNLIIAISGGGIAPALSRRRDW